MIHTSAFPDQSSPHTAARQFTLHLASSNTTTLTTSSSSPSSSANTTHHQRSPRRFDDHINRNDNGGEFSDDRYDVLDKELKHRNIMAAQKGGAGATRNTYYFGLHNAINEVVPTPSCLVAPLSVTSIANSIVGKLNAAKFATSTLGANLLAVTVIEVPLSQRDITAAASTNSSSPASSRSTAVRVVVLVKSMSAIFEGHGEELDYMLSLGKLSASERLLVDAILTATVTCSRVFVDLQETTKKTSSSLSSSLSSSPSRGSQGGRGGVSAAAGKVRHLYPTVGVRPKDNDVDVGSVGCEAPLISAGGVEDFKKVPLVDFEMPSALIGLGRGKGLHRFHHGMASTFSVAFTKVSDMISSLLPPPPSQASSHKHSGIPPPPSSYEIVVLRGTGAPHTSIALAKAAEDYVTKQHSLLLLKQRRVVDTGSRTQEDISGDEEGNNTMDDDDAVNDNNSSSDGGSGIVQSIRGSVRPSTHFELNDYIRGLIRSVSSSSSTVAGTAGGSGSSTHTSRSIIVVVAVISANTEEASLHALWNSCGLSRNFTNPNHRKNAPISGFVLICEDEDAAVVLKKFMTNAAARGAEKGRVEDVIFNSTVVDVDRRSASFSLVVSWKKEYDVDE